MQTKGRRDGSKSREETDRGGGGGNQALLGAGAHTMPGDVASVRLTAAPLIPLGGGALNSTNTSTAAPADTEVHYTTDGSDPRDEASGDAAATSTLCVLECTLAVPQQQPLTLTARSRDAQGDWSPPLVLTLAASTPSPLRINEVADKGNASDAGCAGSDWVELRNPTASAVLLSGLVLSDDHGVPYSKSLALGGAGCPDALGGGELLLLCKDGNASVGGTSYDGCGFEFGIGGSDAVGLYQYNGAVGGEAAVLVDVTTGCCSGDSATSFGRPAGGSVSGNGSFAVLPARTPGLPPFLCGFHAAPSLRQLHLHLLSSDLDSDALKNKKHFNSFATSFLLHPALSDMDSQCWSWQEVGEQLRLETVFFISY